MLMRFPNTSRDRIAFIAADQIWTVPRAGGRATELTTDPARKMLPRFSPDGRWIAFTAVHGATADVDIIPADGGQARRLTYAAVPGIVRGAPDNMVVTWTPDSRSVVFLARKASWESLGGAALCGVVGRGGRRHRFRSTGRGSCRLVRTGTALRSTG